MARRLFLSALMLLALPCCFPFVFTERAEFKLQPVSATPGAELGDQILYIPAYETAFDVYVLEEEDDTKPAYYLADPVPLERKKIKTFQSMGILFVPFITTVGVFTENYGGVIIARGFKSEYCSVEEPNVALKPLTADESAEQDARLLKLLEKKHLDKEDLETLGFHGWESASVRFSSQGKKRLRAFLESPQK